MSNAAWKNPFPVPLPANWDQNKQAIREFFEEKVRYLHHIQLVMLL